MTPIDVSNQEPEGVICETCAERLRSIDDCVWVILNHQFHVVCSYSCKRKFESRFVKEPATTDHSDHSVKISEKTFPGRLSV